MRGRFRILIESRNRSENDSVEFGVVTLFDLAGSENEKMTGEWSQESKFINKVLGI